MEISPAAIQSITITNTHFLQFPLPNFYTQLPISSNSNCPFHHYSFSSSSSHRKWRHQSITTTPAVSGEISSTVHLGATPENDDPTFAVKNKAAEVHADLKGTSIFLVGMNSAMKTSVGQLIANVLQYYYFDSDSVVEEAAGEDLSGKSFRERDEDGFRESETEVLKQLSSMGRLIVNAGNGAVQSITNLALLRHGISIWLDVPLDTIADRKATPDSFSEELSHLAKLYEENRAGYATADATVSVQKLVTKYGYDEFEQVTVEDMALEVLKEIEKLTRVKKMMQEAGRPF